MHLTLLVNIFLPGENRNAKYGKKEQPPSLEDSLCAGISQLLQRNGKYRLVWGIS